MYLLLVTMLIQITDKKKKHLDLFVIQFTSLYSASTNLLNTSLLKCKSTYVNRSKL